MPLSEHIIFVIKAVYLSQLTFNCISAEIVHILIGLRHLNCLNVNLLINCRYLAFSTYSNRIVEISTYTTSHFITISRHFNAFITVLPLTVIIIRVNLIVSTCFVDLSVVLRNFHSLIFFNVLTLFISDLLTMLNHSFIVLMIDLTLSIIF